MNKEEFLKQLEIKLLNLSSDKKKAELNIIKQYIDDSINKGISEIDVIKSLGDIDELVKSINIKYKMVGNSFVDILKAILFNLKNVFTSKDKNLIIKSLGVILYTLAVAIFIKIPFIFVKTLLLDTLNTASVSYSLQNLISYCFEFAYLFVAICIIYRNLKKNFY